MQTENLNEMIQQVSSNPVDVNNPDFIYTLPRKKPTYDEVKNDALNSEKQTMESTIPQCQVEVPKKTVAVKLPDNNYQPESEEALIAYATSIHKNVQTFSIGAYWEIGRTINSFYQGKYGTRELERIANATGIGRDTLNKMCKFARQYSRDQVETLLSGASPVSWSNIAQNLTVEPDKLIQVYQEAEDPKQFHNRIMKLKNPQESRGKSRSPKVIEVKDAEKPITVFSENTPLIPYESIFVEYHEPIQKVESDELTKHSEVLEKELEMLKLENERLKKEMLLRDTKIRELEKTLADVQREKEQHENSYYAYMHKLDKVKTGLENNTPARAILEWMENGDDG